MSDKENACNWRQMIRNMTTCKPDASTICNYNKTTKNKLYIILGKETR